MPALMRIDVALPVPVRSTFTYEVPEPLRESAVRGVRVRVPFGRRTLVGVVLGQASGEVPSEAAIKQVHAVLDKMAAFSNGITRTRPGGLDGCEDTE